MFWPSDWKTRYFYAQKSWSWIIWFAQVESAVQLPALEFLNFRTNFITASMRRLNGPSLQTTLVPVSSRFVRVVVILYMKFLLLTVLIC